MMRPIANPPPFPSDAPGEYRLLDDEPIYDPARHLALERPSQTWSLADLGYDDETIAACSSKVAVTAPFRILSDDGVAAVRETCLRLQDQRTLVTGDRAPSHLSGGVYRSRFLRSICHCPVIADFLSEIAGTPLAPHSMPSQQLFVNYAPDDLSKAVDSWHFDGVGFVYVLMASDPKRLEGGAFEFFLGTKAEATALLDVDTLRKGGTGPLPAGRVVSTRFPAAGYAMFQQGNMLVHRAAALSKPGERITVVPAYVSLDARYPDPTSVEDMPHYQDPGVLSEVAKHAAWQAQGKLEHLIDSLGHSEDRDTLCATLRAATADIDRALRSLQGANTRPEIRKLNS